MLRVVYVRAGKAYPDSRVEKEVNSLIMHGYPTKIIGWNRESKLSSVKFSAPLADCSVEILQIGIAAPYAGGMVKLFWPLCRLQTKIFYQLLAEKSMFEVIHASDLETGLISLIFAKLFKKKMVYDIFDYYADNHNAKKSITAILRKIENFVITHADKVIICSEMRMKQIDGSKPKSVMIIHNSPPHMVQSQYSQPEKGCRTRIVYIGALSNERFIREILLMVSQHEDWELLIGGLGVLSDFIQKCAEKNSNIQWLGEVPYQRVLEIEQTSDILTAIYDPTVPNHYYAAPNKFYEALMLGKPLIMMKNTGMDHFLIGHDIGEVIDLAFTSFEAGFEHAMLRLIERREEWPDMSKRMKDLYDEQFSWNEMENRLLKLYKELEDKDEV